MGPLEEGACGGAPSQWGGGGARHTTGPATHAALPPIHPPKLSGPAHMVALGGTSGGPEPWKATRSDGLITASGSLGLRSLRSTGLPPRAGGGATELGLAFGGAAPRRTSGGGRSAGLGGSFV